MLRIRQGSWDRHSRPAGDASESDGIEEPDLDPDPTAEVPVLTALPAMPYPLPQQPSTVGGQRVRLLPADDLELFWLPADSRWNEPIGSAAIELLINPARASLPPFRCLGRRQQQRRALAGCLQASATPAARLRPAGRCDRAGAAGDADRHAACCPDGLPSAAHANDRRILLRAPQSLTISRVDAVLTFGGDQLC